MTAISAAIVELKAHCEHTWEVIRSLERFARVVEDAHAQAASAVQGASPAVAVVAPTARPARPVKAPAKAAKPNGKPADAPTGTSSAGRCTYAGGAAIIAALGAAGEPLSPTNLIRRTKLARWRVMKTLLLMYATGQLVKVGKNRGAKYALPITPRPGAVAGTQAAPPVGPPSANGRQASPGGFEVAWNGTKERNGEAPPLVGDRARRA